jgi:signal transduction histidine kinase
MDGKVESKQAFRLRMMRQSRLDYACTSFVLALYTWIGVAPWWLLLLHFAGTQLACSLFRWLVRSNVNLRLADPSLLVPQQAFAGLTVFGHLLVAPHLCGMALAGLFTTWHFGTLWYGPRQISVALAWTGAGAALAFALRWDQIALPASTPAEVLLLWLCLMLMLGRFSIVSTHIRELRRALGERSRELEQSLQDIEELTLTRAREEHELALARERQRIMRDIHDGVGSSLIASLALIDRREMGSAALGAVLRDCIDDLKLTIDSLEPLENDLLTLLAALRYRLEKRLRPLGIELEWKIASLPALPWLEATEALSIMRIVQEALANVIHHARATRVCMQARERCMGDAQGVELLIADDGVGMDLCASSVRGKGLRNMRERAASLGGSVCIRSAPGNTTVSLWLPLLLERAPSKQLAA